MMKQYLKSKPRGEQIRLSRACGVHPVYFNSIVNHRRMPSRKLAKKLESETGVKGMAAALLGV